MRNWKRMGALAMAAALGLTSLAGCGSKEEDKTQAPAGTESAAGTESTGGETAGADSRYDADGNWTGETSHIVMTLITAGTDPVDMQKVQDAVNEISVKKIGVEVEFKPVSVFDAPSQVPMWIGAGEQIDLMACAFTGISPYIDMNMIEPLEQWLDTEAPDLQKMAADGVGIYDTVSKDHTYGVAVLGSFEGRGGGYLIRKDYLEEAGLSYENWDKITLNDLDDIFAKVKEKQPDCYSGTLGSLPSAGYTMCYDALGATVASGVLIGTDSTEVVNYFASDEYYDYLKHVRDWYEKGYILKDAATTDVVLRDNIKNGTFWGNFTEGNYGLVEQNEASDGKEWVALMMNDPYYPSVAPSSATYWTVPVTAGEPEAAVRFLNMMMTDEDVTNLLMWGIEGDEYSVADDGKIVMLENYSNWALPGLHGNQQIMTGRSDKQKELDAEWSENARNNKTKGYGYCYDTSAMTNQITAVQAVITEYQAALETGSVDLDTVYPEFIQKLEANGINDIIADNQAQFDAWLAEQ